MKIHQNNRVKQNTYKDECNQNGENHGNYENHESDGKLPHHRNQLTPESHKRSKPINYIHQENHWKPSHHQTHKRRPNFQNNEKHEMIINMPNLNLRQILSINGDSLKLSSRHAQAKPWDTSKKNKIIIWRPSNNQNTILNYQRINAIQGISMIKCTKTMEPSTP